MVAWLGLVVDCMANAFYMDSQNNSTFNTQHSTLICNCFVGWEC